MHNRELERKTVGHAIHGLRPYIKALEVAQGNTTSAGEFRYEIAADRSSARILRNPTPGSDTVQNEWLVVEGTERSIDDWAQLGKKARLAFIALKETKEQLRRQSDHVQFSLNVISGEASLSRGTTVLSEHPTKIEDWAPIGRATEIRYFESFNAALEWNNASAANEVRAHMEKIGILRSERSKA